MTANPRAEARRCPALIVRAEVFDVLSPLAQVQLRLDNGPWLPMAPGLP